MLIGADPGFRQHESRGDAQVTIDADHLDDELTLRERDTSDTRDGAKLCKDFARPDVPSTQASMGYAVESLCLVEIYA
jgi:hypothetical protein